ncbi:MAG: prepilin peptidase [Actinomycetota bacterium]
MLRLVVWAFLGLVFGQRAARRARTLIVTAHQRNLSYVQGTWHTTSNFTSIGAVLGAAAYAMNASTFDSDVATLAFGVFASVCITHALVDIDTHLLVRQVTTRACTLGIPLLAIAAVVDDTPRQLLTALVGVLLSTVVLLAWRALSRGQLGGGDVAVAPMLGFFLGWVGIEVVLAGLLFAAVLGGVFALVGLLTRQLRRSSMFAFGPFLMLGAMIALWTA